MIYPDEILVILFNDYWFISWPLLILSPMLIRLLILKWGAFFSVGGFMVFIGICCGYLSLMITGIRQILTLIITFLIFIAGLYLIINAIRENRREKDTKKMPKWWYQ